MRRRCDAAGRRAADRHEGSPRRQRCVPTGRRSVVDGLASPGPTALERVGELRIGPTTTPGGPVPVGGSTLVTGGAVSADGTVAALRTYTDVYLFSAPDGDLARALTTTTPVRVALPNQPQGEAIAFTPGATCLPGRNPPAVRCPRCRFCRRGRPDPQRIVVRQFGIALGVDREPAASDTTEASTAPARTTEPRSGPRPSFSVVHSWPGSRRSASCGDARVPAGTDPSRRH